MAATVFNLALESGVDYDITATWKDSSEVPINVTGYTAKLQIRTGPGSATALITKDSTLASITLGGALGTVAWSFTNAELTTLSSAARSPLQWDLFMTSPTGKKTKILKGSVTVDPQITV